MKTAVTSTSIDSYHQHRANRFAGQHAVILAYMRPGSIYSRRQLAGLTGFETSAVAGRCNELIENGQLEVCGHIRCAITGRTVEGVRLVGLQMELV